MKVLNIDSTRKGFYDNSAAFFLIQQLLDIAKEAGYTNVLDYKDGKEYTIDELILEYHRHNI